jgi:hypothetical protein
MRVALAEEIDALLRQALGKSAGAAGRHADQLLEFRVETADEGGEGFVHDGLGCGNLARA